MFERFSKEAGKKQYLIPYFIAAHPGTTDEDMLNLALWLKHHDFRLDQVQTFTPTPMAMVTAMYHSGKNPLRKVTQDLRKEVQISRLRERDVDARVQISDAEVDGYIAEKNRSRMSAASNEEVALAQIVVKDIVTGKQIGRAHV